MENYILITVTALLLISLALNVYLFKKRETHKTYDAVNLIHDLTSRKVALVKIERVAPDSVYLRSPKDLV